MGNTTRLQEVCYGATVCGPTLKTRFKTATRIYIRKSIGKIAIIFLITDFCVLQTKRHDIHSWFCSLFVCLFAFPGLNCLNFRNKERAVEFRHGSLRNHFSSLFAPEDVSRSSAAKSEEKRLFSQVKISVTETVCSFIFKITINCVIPELFRLLICVKEILRSPDLQESCYIRA